MSEQRMKRWQSGISILCMILAFMLNALSVRGDTVRMLRSNDDAFSARIELFRSAQREINLATYEIGNCPIVWYLLAELRVAAQRGVVVKILTNGHAGGNLLPAPLQVHLRDVGIQIRQLHANAPLRAAIGPRLHDKLLVVDGRFLIVGGRNLDDCYFGCGSDPFVDRDLLLEGETAKKAQAYFAQRWSDCRVGTRLPACSREAAREAATPLDRAHLMPPAAVLPTNGPVTTHSDGMRYVAEAQFFHDIVGGSKLDQCSIGQQFLRLIDHAHGCILLQTPYLVMSPQFKRTLLAARQRGVRIRILTNSLESTNKPIVHAGYANQRRWLRAHGIEVWEWKGVGTLHAKATVIDGRSAFIGSYNADMLSERRNSEVGVLVHHVGLAAEMTANIESQMRHSQHVPRYGSLVRFDARTNQVSRREIRELRRKRVIAPIIKRYL